MDPWAIALIVLVASISGPILIGLGGWAARRAGRVLPLPSGGSAEPPTTPIFSEAELAELRGELAAVRAEWKAHQKQLDAYLEAFEDLDETVERKRRRTAARVSREKAEPEVELPPREAARMRARALGFKV